MFSLVFLSFEDTEYVIYSILYFNITKVYILSLCMSVDSVKEFAQEFVVFIYHRAEVKCWNLALYQMMFNLVMCLLREILEDNISSEYVFHKTWFKETQKSLASGRN